MGTAVGKAICSDCGTVAKTEADFCKCMRGRTCYGEINVDLNPIELSIVVNGADQKAKIKHIIAAANTLAQYVEQTEQRIKLADKLFNANLSFQDPNGINGDEHGKSGNVSLQATSLEDLKSQVEKAFADFETISNESKENLSEDTNHTALPQTESSVSMDESDLEATDRNIAPPAARFASNDEINGVDSQLKIIKAKLDSMQQDFDKLAQFTNTSNQKQEEIMSGNKDNNLNKKGYFQGAGGVNEPTPGQVKYEKDGLNEHLRDNEDRQMVGQKPFPEVGSVDGLHPSPDSVDTSDELGRKKLLLRADLDERAIRRAAIVSKAKERVELVSKGYFNGTTEPTPGKAQYPVDKLQDQLRDKEDRQMVGQKPFPGVGAVDGLHPSPDSADISDELKRKEKLLRAGLKARFVKAAKPNGSHDQANSAWEIYDEAGKLILTASVDQLTNGRSEELYAAIATKECGADLIGKVRKLGADRVAAGFSKKAQDAAPAPAVAPESPMNDAGAAPPAELGGVAEDTGKDGDPKETALDLAEKVRDVSSDLVEAVRALTGEQAEMGDVGQKADDKSSTASLQQMRLQLNGALITAIKEAVATLNDHEEELKTVVGMYEKGAVNEVNKDFVSNLVDEAVVEAKEAIAESFQLLGAFVKYARGTQAIVKRAHEELALTEGEPMAPEHDSLMAMVEKGAGAMPAADALDAMLAEDMAAADAAEAEDDNDAGAVMTSDPNKAQEMAQKGMDVKVTASFDTTTKEGRAAARAKLAGEMKWNPVMTEFHKHLEDPTFDTKPSNNGGHFETLDETHEAMLDVAQSPPKVRKEAEAIATLISEGKLNPADLDLLVANGVDPEAVKYYKQFWGQAGSEGSQFATELVKEHAKAQAEQDMAQYRVKIARAYELTYEMVDRELIGRDRNQINHQVNEIMKWNDESFESVKKVIASQKPTLRKEASGRMPQVGILGTGDNSTASSDEEILDDTGFKVEADMLTKVLKRLANEQDADENEVSDLSDEDVEALTDPSEIIIEPLEQEIDAPRVHESVEQPEILEFQSIANKMAAKLAAKKKF
ncbi:unnamed protein product [Sphagnum balticum]